MFELSIATKKLQKLIWKIKSGKLKNYLEI